MPDEIVELVDGGARNAQILVRKAFELAGDNYARSTIKTDATPTGEGKTIVSGTGQARDFTVDSPVEYGPRETFEFEINTGSHKDADVILSPLEVVITFDDE